MIEKVDFDVIIVGGGPSGSSLAIFLAKQGKKVLILDKSTFPRDKVCGECISPGALNILEEIGIKAELDKLNIEKVSGVTFCVPQLLPQTVTYPGNNHGYAISRRKLDKLLLDKAVSYENITLIEAFNVKNIQIEKNKVIVSGNKDNETVSYTSSLIVGADGRYSTVAKILGLYELKEKCQREVYVATLEGIDSLNDTVNLEIYNQEIQYLVSKQNDGLTSVCVVINKEKIDKVDKLRFLEMINNSVTLKGKINNPGFESQLKGIKLQSYKLKSLVLDRVMFVGDAIGFIDPITGEGMYRAFKSAKLAAEVINEAFIKNDFSQKSLGIYQKRLLAEFASVYAFIKTAVFLTTNEKLAHLVVNNMSSAKELGEKLVSLQGALIPGNELFSFNTFKLLMYMFKNQLKSV